MTQSVILEESSSGKEQNCSRFFDLPSNAVVNRALSSREIFNFDSEFLKLSRPGRLSCAKNEYLLHSAATGKMLV